MAQRPNIAPANQSLAPWGQRGQRTISCSFCHVPWLPSILCPAVQKALIVAFWRLWLAVLQTSGGGRWSPLQTLWPHTLQVNCVTIGYRVWGDCDDDGGGDGEGHDDEAQCCVIVLGGEIYNLYRGPRQITDINYCWWWFWDQFDFLHSPACEDGPVHGAECQVYLQSSLSFTDFVLELNIPPSSLSIIIKVVLL